MRVILQQLALLVTGSPAAIQCETEIMRGVPQQLAFLVTASPAAIQFETDSMKVVFQQLALLVVLQAQQPINLIQKSRV